MYQASDNRYEQIPYNRCGRSGLKLPAISLGLWHNFGFVDNLQNCKNMLRRAFDRGVTHFDLANNYGPPYGSAESNFGTLFEADFKPYRDELIISTKAGYDMWPGPYGNWGSRKYLLSSLEQSLTRMKLDYVDIFYSHRFDPETPLEETMGALDQAVRSGKALYAGISNYQPEQTQRAYDILKQLGTPFIIHQARYSMLDRWVENGLLNTLENNGLGLIVFSPLAQGLLSDKYLSGNIPADSRAARPVAHLRPTNITPEKLNMLNKLNEMAQQRGQSLAQMAIAWLMKDKCVTSVLIGASKVEQIDNSLDALKNIQFSADELLIIESILKTGN
jgi:L-glyceraldehyde 3-phosphate reductase